MGGSRFQILSFGIIFSVGAIAAFLIYQTLKGFAVSQSVYIAVTQIPDENTEQDIIWSKQEVTLFAAGDIMLGRYVEALMDKNGYNYPFEKISSLLESADYVVGNLEGPIVTNHTQTPTGSLSFSFSNKVAGALKDNYINLVTLANNHTLDRGTSGFQQTREYLSEAGVDTFGHPAEINEDFMFSKNLGGHGLRFIGFNVTRSDFNQDQALQLVSDVSSDQNSIVIISLHWGNEYQTSSNQRQQDLAHALIDSGADLILGHHPHVTQELELYQDRLVVYSLGNFIFDQYFSEETQRGLLLGITLKENAIEYLLFPITSSKSQPELMNDEATGQWLEDLASKSRGLSSEDIKQGNVELVYPTKKPCPCQS